MSTKRTRLPTARRRLRADRKKINRAINMASRDLPLRAKQPGRTRKRVRPKRSNWSSLIQQGIRLLSPFAAQAIRGFGDYKVSGNSLMCGGMTVPEVVNSVKNAGIIIRHKEYLADIDASTTFNLNSYPINPGMIQTFPWLSQVAPNFEQYKFRGILFEFKSLSSDSVLSSATSSALGAVIMSTQYDVLDPPFTNKFNMENYEFANSTKPSLSMIHPIECAKSQTSVSELYIRDGPVPTGADQRLYDLGMFSIATVGMQASSGVAGELWVTYEVELYKPKLIEDLGLEIPTDHFNITGSFGPNAPLGTTTQAETGSTIGGTISPNGQVYNFPGRIVDGHYLFMYFALQNSVAPGSPATTLFNCAGTMWFYNTSSSQIVPSGPSTTQVYYIQVLNISGANASIALQFAGSGVYTAGDLTVTQINGATAGMITKQLNELRTRSEEDEIELFREFKSKLSLSHD
jgi:hypothetical protein